MYWTKFFIPTLKEAPLGSEAISHQLSLRAGLVHMLTSGVYSYLPLGLKVLRKLEAVIREEMTAADATELLMPVLQPLDIWKKTGRDIVLDDVMFKFEDNKKRPMCLGPTHEEIISTLVKDFIQSYRQLPMTLYQIQTKFRDEMRTRFGIVRACEFIMKDAYSFDKDDAGLQINYQKMYEAYGRIFKRCGLDIVILEADSGVMGGDVSHEYMVPAPVGEDAISVCSDCQYKGAPVDKEEKECPKCHKQTLEQTVAIEIGHIFQLGTKYTKALSVLFSDETGSENPIIMGCYGIGVSRVIAAIIESHNDDKGIVWPKEIAPFDIEIIPLPMKDDSEGIGECANQMMSDLEKSGFDVLVDDRNERPGRKFNDADLIGIPLQMIIGKRNIVNGHVELKNRQTGETCLASVENIVCEVKNMSKNLC